MPQVASLYIGDPSIVSEKSLLTLNDVESVEFYEEQGRQAGFILKTSWGKVRGIFIHEQALPHHLLDLEGLVNDDIKEEALLTYTLSRLYHVQLGIKLSIVHSEDNELDVQHFLLRLNNRFNSVMHIYKWLWDWDTIRLGRIGDAAVGLRR